MKGLFDDNRFKLRLYFYSVENLNNVEIRVRYLLINSFFYKFLFFIKWCYINMKFYVVYIGKYYLIFRLIWLNLVDEFVLIYSVIVYYV